MRVWGPCFSLATLIVIAGAAARQQGQQSVAKQNIFLPLTATTVAEQLKKVE